ncbi:MAG: transcription-repair coupling factor, partial [Candidatus Nanopelagicaceae bacterium]
MRGVLPLTSLQIEQALDSQSDLVTTPSAFAFLIARIAMSRPVLVITASSNAASDLAKEIKELHQDTLEFPAWETLPHERLSPSSDTVAKRISTLRSLKDENRNWVVVTPIRAAIHQFNQQVININPINLEIGSEYDLSALQSKLVEFSYSRTDLVEKRGQFAVRGGILDLFPPDQEHPIRIDFFGDEIEDLSYFSVADQRSISEIATKIRVLPCRELLIDESMKKKAAKLSAAIESEILGKIAEGMQPEGMESLIPLLVEKVQLISEAMPDNYQTIFIEKERLISRSDDLLATNEEFREAAWSNAAVGGAVPIEAGSTFVDWESFYQSLGANRDFKQFGTERDVFLELAPIEPLRGNSERLIELFESALISNERIIFSASSRGMVDRYAGILRDANLPVQIQFPLSAAPTSGAIILTASNYRYGFKFDELLFVTERDLTGATSGISERLPSRRKRAIDPLQLKSGDFV